jgi:hypothetical protein
MRYGEEPDEARDFARGVARPELLARLLVPVRIAGHVLFYDPLPALLAWAIGSARWLDVFSAFDSPSLRAWQGSVLS